MIGCYIISGVCVCKCVFFQCILDQPTEPGYSCTVSYSSRRLRVCLPMAMKARFGRNWPDLPRDDSAFQCSGDIVAGVTAPKRSPTATQCSRRRDPISATGSKIDRIVRT